MKKNKKRFSKKEKIIMIILGIVAFICILCVALLPVKRPKDNQNTFVPEKGLNQELTTVQDVIAYLESTFLSMEDSKQEGYDTDIYLSFKYNLYQGDESKEKFFTNLYEKIARVTDFKSFRLIDNSKKITIAVKCSSTGIKEVLINGEKDYFKNEESRRSKDKELKVETLDLKINSNILNGLVSSGWDTSKVNLGTQESTYDKYKIYFDEGYEIREIKGKVYNIVFTKKYNEKVVEDYKVGENLEKIEAALGTSYKDTGVIGYKTKDFYIYFLSDEISIYPNYSYDYTEFENLVKEYDEKKDINDFMDKLTDLWPDYNSYIYDKNYVDIEYALKGVKISFSSYQKDGIQIFENYKGELKKEETKLTDVYYKLNQNLFVQAEKKRNMQSGMYNDDYLKTEDPLHYSEKFVIQINGEGTDNTQIRIESKDGKYPKNELDESIKIYKYIWADDIHLIYSIQAQGLYLYNAETRQTEALMVGEEKFEITNYNRDTKIIEYDGNQAKIEF